MTPVIGISGNLLTDAVPGTISTTKAYVGNAYIEAVTENQGIPFVIPITEVGLVPYFVDKIDGLILSGGQDVSPLFYGQSEVEESTASLLERDQFELALVKEALKQNKAIFAICRGMQLLNVALGGSLVQNIAELNTFTHMQNMPVHEATHPIYTIEGTQTAKLLSKRADVNSFHHQSIDRLGTGLVASAYAEDGTIEAVELADRPNVIGVQWHPEMMQFIDQKMKQLFHFFIKNATSEFVMKKRVSNL